MHWRCVPTKQEYRVAGRMRDLPGCGIMINFARRLNILSTFHSITMARFFRIAAVAAALICVTSARAQAPRGGAVFGNEKSDTTLITDILIKAVEGPRDASAQDYVLTMAMALDGTPYKEGTLEGGDDRSVRVNLQGMDCTTMVETALALAVTAGERRSSWRDFVYNLERLRYRGGSADGFASRLHYVSDWALDNHTRGLLREVTDRVGNAHHQVKSIDWMTRHRDQYAAMRDSATYAEVKHVEEGFHGFRVSYIKPSNVKGARLSDGDIVAFTSRKDGLDVGHIGIVKMVKGKPHLLHASKNAGKVTLEAKPLTDYLRLHREFTGIRIFRLQ